MVINRSFSSEKKLDLLQKKYPRWRPFVMNTERSLKPSLKLVSSKLTKTLHLRVKSPLSLVVILLKLLQVKANQMRRLKLQGLW